MHRCYGGNVSHFLFAHSAERLIHVLRWKLGQLRPGNTVQFKRISFEQAMELEALTIEYLDQVSLPNSPYQQISPPLFATPFADQSEDPKLHVVPAKGARPRVIFRQAGDSAILVEYGELLLDFHQRARIHAFESELRKRELRGVWTMSPCIRSTLVCAIQIASYCLLTMRPDPLRPRCDLPTRSPRRAR